ncbi:MAG TPA: lysylphosphatidylglycerol synthase domain-containing protein [Steroidobacteraceae bacterium]
MTRPTSLLLSAGALLFIAVLATHGLPAVFATLALAGWGLLLVALFHLLPLALDAAAIRVLFQPNAARGAWRAALLARWAGESVNSVMPGGQIGGPVMMVRDLAQRGMPLPQAAAAITVSTTFQTLGQILFALSGLVLLGARASQATLHAIRTPLLMTSGVLALCLTGFYLVQRHGLFRGLTRATARVFRKRDWSELMSQAEAIDIAVRQTHTRHGRVAASFVLSLIGWLVGTGEVYLILLMLRSPVGWADAMLLESLGQAIRGAAFAIPGALGVQEGGYLLLAPLAGLSSETALALSLAKRARELLLGVPGLLYLHLAERDWRRRRVACAGAGE